ncbi:hypothetical protein [Iamia sp.]|uniref:hypothetical protein n=1 Tax=Iamia sp. TaxID=2722710 RepID=UPI002D7F0496|nr:hypothetical protein [Iamia sp.]
MIPSARAHTAGVIAALEAAGLQVGRGVAPAGVDPPYVVVHAGGLSVLDGPVSGSHADASPTMHVVCVGETADQAEWGRDKAAAALLGIVTVAGRSRLHPPELEASQPVRRDDDRSPPIFEAVDIYRIHTTPA